MTVEMQRQDVLPKSGQSAAPKRKRADTNEPITTSNKRRCLTQSLCLSNDDDIKVLDTIDARYEVQLQSVISSSKIQQRVTAMLRHLTPPTQSSPTEPPPDTTTSKTRVSILRAKAADAGKLVSIAEIAKREIEEEQAAGNDVTDEADQGRKAGRWFQYIALGEELLQKPRNEGSTIIEETVLGGPNTNRGNRDDDDEFEVMKTPFERAIEGRPLARGVPVMSLFLSRSPIEELKKRYGEQTNVPPT
ncbi:hypothetical protein FHL15_003372 [Xylaria flabelliformis]|uniref:Uncharacterized protein n=1 Tax=Xylaria flabelliformis TaxID=2512241 RepID=A0A553I6I5_9PEZI|nr:hypothetical protein FHL15_003372 [Xylaria flabelliformis]